MKEENGGGGLCIGGFYGLGNEAVHITSTHILLDKAYHMFTSSCKRSWEM